MISDDDIEALPEDDEEAFVQYESLLRQSVRDFNQLNENRGWDIEREYVAHVLAFIDTRLPSFDLPRHPPSEGSGFADWYQDFVRAIDYYKATARLRISSRKKANVVLIALSSDFKTQIGGHLTAIRNIVGKANVPEGKRDAIYRRINGLQEEVDRDRTRTEAVMALWLDVTSAIGKGAENLDPAIDRLQTIVKIISRARDENEQKALEPPQERKRLTAPTTSYEDFSDTAAEDEIPF